MITAPIHSFIVHPIRGAGRGKGLGYPTINVRLEDVPDEIEEGVYAGWITIDNQQPTVNNQQLIVDSRQRSVSRANPAKRDERVDCRRFPAAIHYGPRPFFDDTVAFEVHLIDYSPTPVPDSFTLKLVKRLRSVRHFSTVQSLKEQIAMDIDQTRDILNNAEFRM